MRLHFGHIIQERILGVARFPRAELGEKCEKHILQEIAEETECGHEFPDH